MTKLVGSSQGLLDTIGTVTSGIGHPLFPIDEVSGWRDNIQPFSSAKAGGPNDPTWADMGNGQHAFRFTAGDELFVAVHVDHDYQVGSKAYPHIHFCVDQTMTLGQQITWSFNYVLARGHSQGDSLTAAETTLLLVYTATGNEVAGEHIILEVSDGQSFVLIEPDTVLLARVKVDSENVLGNIFGIMGDLHYQSDKTVTKNKTPPFFAQ